MINHSKIRLFAGVGLGRRHIGALSGYLAKLSGLDILRTTPLANIHLTVCFIGERDKAELPGIVQSIGQEAKKHRACTLPYMGIKLMPKPNPYMLWSSFGSIPEFESLHRGLHGCLCAGPYRPPKPHITLARAKGRESLDGLCLPDGPEMTGLLIDHLHLYQSVLSDNGSTYKILESFQIS